MIRVGGTASFGSGPTMLPAAVLDEVRADLVDYAGTGLSILELAQTDPAVLAMYDQAERDARELLGVPEGHRVLFLHAGASTHFAMVPLNLLRGRKTADYVATGLWSRKAIDQARAYADVAVIADASDSGYTRVPVTDRLACSPGAAYLHYTWCDSVQGLEFAEPPAADGVPLVCDATASLFAREIPVHRHALIYASTQKNLGATGMTLVVVAEDVLGQPSPTVPLALDYTHQARCRGRFTTPPIYSWYLAGRMLAWMRQLGGLAAVAECVRTRSARIYAAIDASGYYRCPVEPGSRSRTSIPFTLADPDLSSTFLAEAETAGLRGLAGHSSVGGLRAGLFAGTPDHAVDQLLEFLAYFERRYG